MKTQSAFVRTDCRIHLHAIAAVDMGNVVIVLPRHTESYHAFRLNDSLKKFLLFILRIFFQQRYNRRENFFDCILEFDLVGVAPLNKFQHVFHILFHFGHKTNLLRFSYAGDFITS